MRYISVALHYRKTLRVLGLSLFAVLIGCSSSPDEHIAVDASVEINDEQAYLHRFEVEGISAKQWTVERFSQAWRRTTNPQIELSASGESVVRIAVSQDGKWMVGAGTSLILWSLDSFEVIHSVPLDRQVSAVAITAEGQSAAVAYTDGTVDLFDLGAKALLYTLRGHGGVSTMRFSPKGTRLAVADTNKTLFIWDARTGSLLFNVDDVSDVKALAFSPNGRMLASAGITGEQKNTIQVWDTRLYTLQASLIGQSAPINALEFSADSQKIFSAGNDNLIFAWSVNTGSVIHRFKGHTDNVTGLTVSSNGRWLFSGGLDNTLRVWSTEGKLLRVLTASLLRPNTLAFANNRNWLFAIAGNNSAVQVWSATGYSYMPWDDIQAKVSEGIAKLNQRNDIPFVSKPLLPPAKIFQKSPFESKSTFIRRMSGQYLDAVDQVLRQYREQVDERNRRIAALRDGAKSFNDVAIQGRYVLVKDVVQEILGNTLILPLELDGRPRYDAEKQVMIVRVSFGRAYYQEDFSISVPEGSVAFNFYEQLNRQNLVATAHFGFTSNSRVRISHITVPFSGRIFVGKPLFLSGGFRVIAEEDLKPKVPDYTLQNYDLPYTNFQDYIEYILSNPRVNAESQTSTDLQPTQSN